MLLLTNNPGKSRFEKMLLVGPDGGELEGKVTHHDGETVLHLSRPVDNEPILSLKLDFCDMGLLAVMFSYLHADWMTAYRQMESELEALEEKEL